MKKDANFEENDRLKAEIGMEKVIENIQAQLKKTVQDESKAKSVKNIK